MRVLPNAAAHRLVKNAPLSIAAHATSRPAEFYFTLLIARFSCANLTLQKGGHTG